MVILRRAPDACLEDRCAGRATGAATHELPAGAEPGGGAGELVGVTPPAPGYPERPSRPEISR
jgi:hypothetical protein